MPIKGFINVKIKRVIFHSNTALFAYTIYFLVFDMIFNYNVGRIINVSSVAGLYGYPGLSVYSATKHALEGYSAALRQECAKFNVNVVTVQPGDFSKATHLLDNHHR